jgi:UDP-glucose 6-dehydrogenase
LLKWVNWLLVDFDEKKKELIKQGVSPIYEADLEALMKKNYTACRLYYTTDYKSAYKEADDIFIGVELQRIIRILAKILQPMMEKTCIKLMI